MTQLSKPKVLIKSRYASTIFFVIFSPSLIFSIIFFTVNYIMKQTCQWKTRNLYKQLLRKHSKDSQGTLGLMTPGCFSVFDSDTRLVWLDSWEHLLRGTRCLCVCVCLPVHVRIYVCLCVCVFTWCNTCSSVCESLWSGVSAWIDISPGRSAVCYWWLPGASWNTQKEKQFMVEVNI